jgi:hypothetical protein
MEIMVPVIMGMCAMRCGSEWLVTDYFIDSSTVLTTRKFGTFTTPLQTRLVRVMVTDIQRPRELTGMLMVARILVRLSSLVRLSMVLRANRLGNGGKAIDRVSVLDMLIESCIKLQNHQWW